MDVPAATANLSDWCLARNGFLASLRQSISAHGIFLAIVAAYYASFLVLLRLYPDVVPTDFLVAAIGFHQAFRGFHISVRFHHAVLSHCDAGEAGTADPCAAQRHEAISDQQKANGQWHSDGPHHDDFHVCVRQRKGGHSDFESSRMGYVFCRNWTARCILAPNRGYGCSRSWAMRQSPF